MINDRKKHIYEFNTKVAVTTIKHTLEENSALGCCDIFYKGRKPTKQTEEQIDELYRQAGKRRCHGTFYPKYTAFKPGATNTDNRSVRAKL